MFSPLNSQITSPNPLTPFPNTHTLNLPSFPHPNNHRRRQRRRYQTPFTVNSSHINKQFVPLKLPTTAGLNSIEQRQDKVSISNVVKHVSKTIAITVFCSVFGLCPILGFNQNHAIAVPAISEVLKLNRGKSKQVERKWNDHEFSRYTRRLLEVVAKLVRVIEEVRSENGDLESVDVVLKDVKLKKKELQDEIMSKLYGELSVLREKKAELDRTLGGILDSLMKCKKEKDKILERSGEKKGKDRVMELDEVISDKEKEFMVVSEEIGEIEDQMSVKETMALSIGVRELCFIERESTLLVENFIREMKQKDNKR